MEKYYKSIIRLLLVSFLLLMVCCFKSRIIAISQNYKSETTKLICGIKEYYNSNEIIDTYYYVNSGKKIDSFEYSLQGFTIEREIIKENSINISLKVVNECEYLYLQVNALFKDGTNKLSIIYGINTSVGVFISKYSYGNAKQLYYEFLLNKGIIDEKQLYNNINNDIKQSIIYEKKENLNMLRSSVELDTKLVWIEDGETATDEHPLAFTKFQIIDNNTSTVTTYYTDENGNFPSGIYVNVPSNLKIKIYASGVNTGVYNCLFGSCWTYEDNYDESVSKITVTSTSITDYGRAQQVSQALIYAEKYAKLINGTALSFVKCVYPATSTSYSSFPTAIYISGDSSDPDYADWDVIMHEYGHHFAHCLNLENSSKLDHSLNDNLADRYDKSRGVRLAWAEALATIFGAIAQEYYNSELSTINYVADAGYSDDVLIYYYNDIINRTGEACEQTIIGILWDLFDTDVIIENHDDSSMTDSQFWNIMISSEATTLSQYVSYYYSYYTDAYNRDKLNKIIEYYKVSPENVHISTYSNNLTYSPPTFYWTVNGTSSTLLNDSFVVRIYREDCLDYMDISTTDNYLTLTQSQWNTIINWPRGQIIIVVYACQNDTPLTGPYGSKCYIFNKPQFQIIYTGNTVSIIGLNFETAFLNIPSQINEKQVTTLAENAFKNRIIITDVLIPNTIISIGNAAFKGCTSLESITIPSSVSTIGDDAFRFCFSLSEVIVLKDTIPITTLGEHAFDDCDSHLEIKVPINRVADYKASAYWSSYSNRIVPNIPITSTIGIDCLTEDDVEIQLNANENKYYKLVIDCGKSYQFVADDLNDVTITIYNSNMALIYSNSENNNNNTLTGFLSPGIYYLKIEYASIYDYGLFTLEYSPTYLITNSALLFGTNNIQNSIHSINNNKKHGYFSYSHTLGEGFFKFSLNGGYNNNYPANAITIYTNSNKTNALARYPINNSINAISNINENELYVYIPSNGTYYIDLLLYASNSLNTTFTISNLDISIMDYTNNLQFLSFNFVFEEQDTFSYFKEVSISHKSKMQIDINSLGTTSDDIPIYLYKREIEPGNDPGNIYYSYTLISNSSWKITSNTYSPLYTIVLEAGTYYLGYSNNINHIDITIALRRVVDYDASSLGTLITDPTLNQGYTLGSEVNFNGGLPQDTTITEGFTRCIYLMFGNFIELPDSRLDYDWYSSNDSVASVTHYGTVLGKPVNTNINVRIYAVLKEDPSVVFSIELTILDDTETDEIEIISNLSYSYSTENGIYQLALDNSNSPYPWINYYIWAIDIANDYPNLEVEMNQWGYITSNGTGEAIITANYHLNPRVYLTIYLTITT